MAINLPLTRIALYAILGLFSAVLFCLCAVRLHYTTHLSPYDPLNGGEPFYDPIIVELLVTALFTIFWCIFIISTIHKRIESRLVSTFRAELIGLAFLWIMWIVGAAVASNSWAYLSWCWRYEPCRVLSALVSFAWLGWLVLTAIFVVCLLFTTANRAYHEPLHGRWDPRVSIYA